MSIAWTNLSTLEEATGIKKSVSGLELSTSVQIDVLVVVEVKPFSSVFEHGNTRRQTAEKPSKEIRQ